MVKRSLLLLARMGAAQPVLAQTIPTTGICCHDTAAGGGCVVCGGNPLNLSPVSPSPDERAAAICRGHGYCDYSKGSGFCGFRPGWEACSQVYAAKADKDKREREAKDDADLQFLKDYLKEQGNPR